MKQKTTIRATILSLAIIVMSFSFSPLAFAASTPGPSTQVSQQQIKDSLKNNPLVDDIQTVVNILSAGVGIVVVIMIMVGGVQYSIAGDNPAALTAAKKRITDALIALFAFAFSFAFIQWLIPGGIFG